MFLYLKFYAGENKTTHMLNMKHNAERANFCHSREELIQSLRHRLLVGYLNNKNSD